MPRGPRALKGTKAYQIGHLSLLRFRHGRERQVSQHIICRHLGPRASTLTLCPAGADTSLRGRLSQRQRARLPREAPCARLCTRGSSRVGVTPPLAADPFPASRTTTSSLATYLLRGGAQHGAGASERLLLVDFGMAPAVEGLAMGAAVAMAGGRVRPPAWGLVGSVRRGSPAGCNCVWLQLCLAPVSSSASTPSPAARGIRARVACPCGRSRSRALTEYGPVFLFRRAELHLSESWPRRSQSC